MKILLIIIICIFLTGCNKDIESKEKQVYNSYIEKLSSDIKNNDNLPFDIEVYIDRITKYEVSKGSHLFAYWKCCNKDKGHPSYQVIVNDKTEKNSCPLCRNWKIDLETYELARDSITRSELILEDKFVYRISKYKLPNEKALLNDIYKLVYELYGYKDSHRINIK